MNLDFLLLILWTESSFRNEKEHFALSSLYLYYFVTSFFWKVVW